MVDERTIKAWMLEEGNILYDPKHPGVFTGYVTFTPERLKSALENNTHNRPMGKNRQIPPLKDAILNGQWDDNVSKFNFDKYSVLSDGQNRMQAALDVEATIRVMVTWGVEESAQVKTDRRGARTLSNDLAIHGVKNSNNVAAIGRIVFMKNHGATPQMMINSGWAKTAYSDASLFYATMKEKDEIVDKANLVHRIYQSIRDLKVSGGIINVLALEFDEINHEDAECFWERLREGVTTFENDPIMALRKRLVDNARSNTNKMPQIVQAALIIKAWNFYMRGETVKQLKYTSGGANPEPFPEIFNPYLNMKQEEIA